MAPKIITEDKEPLSSHVIKVIGSDPVQIQGFEYKNANLLLFEGREYIVSHKAVLTINCTSSCNATCKFCCNGITHMDDGPYVRLTPALQRVISLAKLGNIKVIAYSGGEPTLSPQHLFNLASQTSHLFDESRLHSNGIGLFRIIKDRNGNTVPLIDALVDLGLFGCSISLAHYDLEINREIMGFRGPYQGLTEEELKYVASLDATNFSPRLSCFLAEDGISNTDDILHYIDFGETNGFNKFIFRAGTQIPPEYAAQGSFAGYNAKSIVDIDVIVNELLSKHGYKEAFSLHKSDSHVHVLRKGRTILDFDQSTEETDKDSKIRRIIFMPNGVALTSSEKTRVF